MSTIQYKLAYVWSGTEWIPLGAGAPDFQLLKGEITFENTPKVGNAIMWHANNDGSASGLDADKLDGKQGAEYALATHDHDFLSGTNPTVTGTLTSKTVGNVDVLRIGAETATTAAVQALGGRRVLIEKQLPYSMKAGQIEFTVAAGQSIINVQQTFEVGEFSQTPIVVANVQGATTALRGSTVRLTGVSPTIATFEVRMSAAAPSGGTTGFVNFYAVQMLTNASAG